MPEREARATQAWGWHRRVRLALLQDTKTPMAAPPHDTDSLASLLWM